MDAKTLLVTLPMTDLHREFCDLTHLDVVKVENESVWYRGRSIKAATSRPVVVAGTHLSDALNPDSDQDVEVRVYDVFIGPRSRPEWRISDGIIDRRLLACAPFAQRNGQLATRTTAVDRPVEVVDESKSFEAAADRYLQMRLRRRAAKSAGQVDTEGAMAPPQEPSGGSQAAVPTGRAAPAHDGPRTSHIGQAEIDGRPAAASAFSRTVEGECEDQPSEPPFPRQTRWLKSGEPQLSERDQQVLKRAEIAPYIRQYSNWASCEYLASAALAPGSLRRHVKLGEMTSSDPNDVPGADNFIWNDDPPMVVNRPATARRDLARMKEARPILNRIRTILASAEGLGTEASHDSHFRMGIALGSAVILAEELEGFAIRPGRSDLSELIRSLRKAEVLAFEGEIKKALREMRKARITGGLGSWGPSRRT